MRHLLILPQQKHDSVVFNQLETHMGLFCCLNQFCLNVVSPYSDVHLYFSFVYYLFGIKRLSNENKSYRELFSISDKQFIYDKIYYTVCFETVN